MTKFIFLILSFTCTSLSAQLMFDPSFGQSGVDTLAISNYDNIFCLASQTDGKTIAAGCITNTGAFGSEKLCLVRFNIDGSIDNSFGSNGVDTFTITPFDNSARAIVLQPDGKIVIGLSTYPTSSYDVLGLVRLNIDGSLDNSFGTNGVVFNNFNNHSAEVLGVSLQTDGKIIEVGSTYLSGKHYFATARYNIDGSIDSTFGTAGVDTFFSYTYGYAYISLEQPDHKILVGGDRSLLRYTSTGQFDSTFGTNGVVSLAPPGGEIICLKLLPGGKILAAGTSNQTYFVALYNQDGSPDLTFGNAGYTTEGQIPLYFGMSMAIQLGGKILIAAPKNDGDSLTLMRFTSNGIIDTSYGYNGVFTAPSVSKIYSTLFQSDGKILTGSTANARGGTLHHQFGVSRYITGLFLGTIDVAATINSTLFYPNPLQNSETLEYELTQDSKVSLQLYDEQGRCVKNLITNELQLTGKNKLITNFDNSLSKGVYFLRLQAGDNVTTIKVLKD